MEVIDPIEQGSMLQLFQAICMTLGGNDAFSGSAEGNIVSFTILIELLLPAQAELSFQAALWVVDSCVDDLAVTAARVTTEIGFLIHNDNGASTESL